MEDDTVEAFREVNLSDGKCNVSLYVCAEEERKIDTDPEYASELFKAALEGRLPAAEESDAEPGAASDSEVNEAKENLKKDKCEVEWDSPATWFFLSLIQKNCHLLPLNTGHRNRLFQRVQEDLREEGYDIPLESIRQKFNSLVTTYNRIQFKGKRVGKVKTRWEFYDIFDKIMQQAGSHPATDLSVPNNSVKDPIFVDLNIKEEDDDPMLYESIPVESVPSPPLPHSGSSNSVSREASPVPQGNYQSQKPVTLSKSRPEIQANKKRKLTNQDEGASFKKHNANKKKLPQNEGDVPLQPDVVGAPMTNGLMEGAEHIIISGEGFNHTATLLFIDCLKKNKGLLKKKSTEMFTRIRLEMATEGFSFTEAKLRKKWYNLLISYRRILERANEIGDLVSSWPYYEAVDSIIRDSKDFAQSKMVNGNENSNSPESSYPLNSGCSRLQERQSDDDTSFVPKRNSKKTKQVLDLVSISDEQSSSAFPTEDDDYKRKFMEEWEQREQRREERDLLKLNALQKIAESMKAMIRKQDVLINLLKKLD